jgi:hypothetical protein
LAFFPSCDFGFGGSQIDSHGPLHEPPDRQGKDEDESQGFDTSRSFEKQGVDKDRALEERKVILYRVLILVDRK